MLRWERRISPPWLKSVTAVEGNNVPAPTKGASPPSYRKPLCPWATVFSSIFLEQQFSQITASVHPTRYLEVSREARRSALLPFSARATFHPDCTVGTGFSPVRPLLRAGFSSGVLASCADAKIRTISACLRERFAGCDRRFGISPTPEHDVDTDYATAHAGVLICFLWDNFRDKMTFCDHVPSTFSRPISLLLSTVTCGVI